MKKQISITMFVIVLATLSVSGKESHQHNDKKETTVNTNAETTKLADVNAKVSASIKEIVEQYLKMKNALVADNTKDAATTGKAMFEAFGKLDKSLLTAEQKKIYVDIEDDAKEHAEHIGENAGKIEHQREHFVILSKDIYDLIKPFGSEQPLYKFFCPMANDGKGAIWLSEYKETKNPYYGKKMLTCGSIKEEIKK